MPHAITYPTTSLRHAEFVLIRTSESRGFISDYDTQARLYIRAHDLYPRHIVFEGNVGSTVLENCWNFQEWLRPYGLFAVWAWCPDSNGPPSTYSGASRYSSAPALFHHIHVIAQDQHTWPALPRDFARFLSAPLPSRPRSSRDRWPPSPRTFDRRLRRPRPTPPENAPSPQPATPGPIAEEASPTPPHRAPTVADRTCQALVDQGNILPSLAHILRRLGPDEARQEFIRAALEGQVQVRPEQDLELYSALERSRRSVLCPSAAPPYTVSVITEAARLLIRPDWQDPFRITTP